MNKDIRFTQRGGELSRELRRMCEESSDLSTSLAHVGFSRLSKVFYKQSKSLLKMSVELRELISDKVDEDVRNARGMSKAVIESALVGAKLEKQNHE